MATKSKNPAEKPKDALKNPRDHEPASEPKTEALAIRHDGPSREILGTTPKTPVEYVTHEAIAVTSPFTRPGDVVEAKSDLFTAPAKMYKLALREGSRHFAIVGRGLVVEGKIVLPDGVERPVKLEAVPHHAREFAIVADAPAGAHLALFVRNDGKEAAMFDAVLFARS